MLVFRVFIQGRIELWIKSMNKSKSFVYAFWNSTFTIGLKGGWGYLNLMNVINIIVDVALKISMFNVCLNRQ